MCILERERERETGGERDTERERETIGRQGFFTVYGAAPPPVSVQTSSFSPCMDR